MQHFTYLNWANSKYLGTHICSLRKPSLALGSPGKFPILNFHIAFAGDRSEGGAEWQSGIVAEGKGLTVPWRALTTTYK